jgi:hypothetical protein
MHLLSFRLNTASLLAAFAALNAGCVTRTVYVMDDRPSTRLAPAAEAPAAPPDQVQMAPANAAPQAAPQYAYEQSAGISDPYDFVQPLNPYGSWVQYPGYGLVFVPARAVVGANFRPYTNGHWEHTEWGWTWVDHHPFGWATGHYGRWFFDANYGWAWLPGTQWGPAWVTWRNGGGHIGWAAMPPGSIYGGAYSVYDTSWVFVSTSNFGATSVGGYLVTGSAYRGCYASTYPSRSTVVVYGRNTYRGPDYDEVRRETRVIHRPISETERDRPVTRPPAGTVISRDRDGDNGRSDSGSRSRDRDGDNGRSDSGSRDRDGDNGRSDSGSRDRDGDNGRSDSGSRDRDNGRSDRGGVGIDAGMRSDGAAPIRPVDVDRPAPGSGGDRDAATGRDRDDSRDRDGSRSDRGGVGIDAGMRSDGAAPIRPVDVDRPAPGSGGDRDAATGRDRDDSRERAGSDEGRRVDDRAPVTSRDGVDVGRDAVRPPPRQPITTPSRDGPIPDLREAPPKKPLLDDPARFPSTRPDMGRPATSRDSGPSASPQPVTRERVSPAPFTRPSSPSMTPRPPMTRPAPVPQPSPVARPMPSPSSTRSQPPSRIEGNRPAASAPAQPSSPSSPAKKKPAAKGDGKGTPKKR